MTKKEIQQRVLQNGKPLPLDRFTWDDKTNTFSSSENHLVLDFNDIDNCTFNTYSSCTFKTGSNCTFKTGSNCTFNTDYSCTFNTDYSCTFKTGVKCVLVRRDVYEVIELEEGKKIKLNDFRIKGFTYVDEKLEKMITLSNGKKVSESTVIEALRAITEEL